MADNATVVALVAEGMDLGTFNVYEVRDMDSTGSTDFQVTLMGTVPLTDGQTFNDLADGNII